MSWTPTEKDVYGQESGLLIIPGHLTAEQMNAIKTAWKKHTATKPNYIMNPANNAFNANGRPEAFTTSLEERLSKLHLRLEENTSRIIRKGNDLMGQVPPSTSADPQHKSPEGCSPIMPCYTDRMNAILRLLEREVDSLNYATLRLEGF